MKTHINDWEDEEDNVPHFEKIKKKKPSNWTDKSDKKRDRSFKKQKHNNVSNNVNRELGS